MALSKPTLPVLLLWASLITALHFVFIRDYGLHVPYYDQWLAEAKLLYLPILEGTFDWRTLFAPHNEHIIAITRIFQISFFYLNGQWDPLLLNMAGSATLSLLLVACVSVIQRHLGPAQAWLALGVLSLLWSFPFACDNILWSFQNQFHFLLGFSILAVLLLVGERALSPGWWAGWVFSALALLSMGAGVLAAAASFSVLVLRLGAQSAWRSPKAWVPPALVGLVVIAGACMQMGTVGAMNDQPLKLSQFLIAMAQALAAPAIDNPELALLLWLPALLWLVHGLRSTGWRGFTQGSSAILLGLAALILLNDAALAYARGGTGKFSIRHLELPPLSLLLNAACLLDLLRSSGTRITRATLHTWPLLAVVVCALCVPNSLSRMELWRWRDTLVIDAMREYRATGDKLWLDQVLRGRFGDKVDPQEKDLIAALIAKPQLAARLPACIALPTAFHTAPATSSQLGIHTLMASPLKDAAFESSLATDIHTPYFQVDVRFHYDDLEQGAMRYGLVHPNSSRSEWGNTPSIAWHNTWRTITMPNIPGTALRLENSSQNGWIEFSSPRPFGRLSYLAEKISSRAEQLALLAAFLLLLALLRLRIASISA